MVKTIRKAIEEIVSNFEDDYNFSNNSDFNELMEEVEDRLYNLENEGSIKAPSNYIGYLIQKNTGGVYYTNKYGYRLNKVYGNKKMI